MTSLTREALLAKGKPKSVLVKDVPGFGDVWLRSCPQVQRSRRNVAYGNNPSELENEAAHRLIDQVLLDETTPMFTDEDVDTLNELGADELAPLHAAIFQAFGDDQKKVKAESNGTSKS